MTKDESQVVGCLAGIPTMLIVWPLCAVLYGFTLSKLWAWFMVPIFHLPSLGVLQAIGIILVMHVFGVKRPARDKEKEKDETLLGVVLNGLAFAVIYCGLSLLEGWIVFWLINN